MRLLEQRSAEAASGIGTTTIDGTFYSLWYDQDGSSIFFRALDHEVSSREITGELELVRWMNAVRRDVEKLKQETADTLLTRLIEAMKRAWARTQNGTSGNEAGFVLNGGPSNYSIVDTTSDYTKNKQKMAIYGNTFLLFHVHPNSSTRNPSTPENNARGNRRFGDTTISDNFYQEHGRRILFLVGHRTGLMYECYSN